MKIKLFKDVDLYEKFWWNGDVHRKDIIRGDTVAVRISDETIVVIQKDHPVEILKGLRLGI